MQFRLYLLDVSELEDDNLQQKALSLMDSFRKGKVTKYKTLKDRLHQIATGLLLQVGILELDVPEAECIEAWRKVSILDDQGREEIQGNIYICHAKSVVQYLEKSIVNNCENSIPVDVKYDIKENGKPYWQQKFLEKFPTKQFLNFNISHSGAYAALIICDKEIGLDIQQKRYTTFEGGYQEFSRMEAFVKCTGQGYAKGFQRYKELDNDKSRFTFCKIELLEDYVIYACYVNEMN